MKARRVRDWQAAGRSVRRVGVVGAGQMGSGIAASLVRAGIPTALVDVSPALLEAGVEKVRKIAAGAASAPGPLATGTGLEILADCDVVIEAITEDEAIKTATFGKLGAILPRAAILASNTSTIPITRMAMGTARPENFGGMHFFHPVHRMELVEVIRGERTGDEAVATLAALAVKLGKVPIVVRDCPGFFSTRVLFPYLNESLRLLREGVEMDAIDEAAVEFGVPRGPLSLLDLIGLDTALAISNVMAGGYPDRMESSPLLSEMVGAGRLGRKTGAGFRTYGPEGTRKAPDPFVASTLERYRIAPRTPDKGDIADRLFLPMLVESTRVLEEGIVREPSDVDLGVILGFGFPAARGGILRWCDSAGADAILKRLESLEDLGPVFRPSDLLRGMARRGEAFYPPRREGSQPGE